uniref:PHB domain-containing protein n=1 Tax=Syphacia muris TaxID=451379 RepID=A0A0N5AX53_9BILA
MNDIASGIDKNVCAKVEAERILYTRKARITYPWSIQFVAAIDEREDRPVVSHYSLIVGVRLLDLDKVFWQKLQIPEDAGRSTMRSTMMQRDVTAVMR